MSKEPVLVEEGVPVVCGHKLEALSFGHSFCASCPQTRG